MSVISKATAHSMRYQRPSKRGARGGKREIVISSRRYEDRGNKVPGRPMERRVPYVRISGQWLASIGFREGNRVEIIEERGRLILTCCGDATVPVTATKRSTRSKRSRR